MERYLKKISIIFMLCVIAGLGFAKEANYQGDDYDIYLYYNETACPGDAVFVRLMFSQNNKKNKVSKEQFQSTKATLYLYMGDKVLDKSEFYEINDTASKGIYTLLTGIPLSSWWTSDNNYKLKISYDLYGESRNRLEFELPFYLTAKDFVSEDIPLNDSSSQARTDSSTIKAAQIERLNNVLSAIDKKAIYQTSPFDYPTKSTRLTSFFADRRVYIYSNGKKATGLHYGLDYGVPENSEVLSCADGKVVLAENRITTGWSVVVEHLPGLYSLYYHMNELKVEQGQTIKKGDLIGLSGMTGVATGPHIHWEVRLNTVAVNPEFFTNDFTFLQESRK